MPTEVTAAHLPISGQGAVSLVCSSVWQIATWGDRARLEGDFDQLCAYLITDPGQERDRLGDEVRRRWQDAPPGSVTRKERGLTDN